MKEEHKKIIVAFDPATADVNEAKILQELKDREGDIIIIGAGEVGKTMYIDKAEAAALEAKLKKEPSWNDCTDITKTVEPIMIRNYPYLEPYIPPKKEKEKPFYADIAGKRSKHKKKRK